MNKITVINNEVKFKTDDSLKIEVVDRFELFDVKKIIIKNSKNSNLEIEYNSSDIKIDVVFDIKENTNLDVFELNESDKLKAQYNYYLNENSNLNITKFYDTKSVKEVDVIELNGENAIINYNLKTISNGKQKFDLIVYHHNKNTISNVKNQGVSLTGPIEFDVTSIVYQGVKECIINQNNRIITCGDEKCKINPKLLIDEEDVSANHSALIGKFSFDELFYLQSRGISLKKTMNLLVKGFLLENIENEKLDKILEKYWR